MTGSGIEFNSTNYTASLKRLLKGLKPDYIVTTTTLKNPSCSLEIAMFMLTGSDSGCFIDTARNHLYIQAEYRLMSFVEPTSILSGSQSMTQVGLKQGTQELPCKGPFTETENKKENQVV